MGGPHRNVEATIRQLYRDVELAVRESTVLLGHDGTVVGSLKAEGVLGVPEGSLVGGPPMPANWGMADEHGVPVLAEDHPALRTMRSGKKADIVLLCLPPDGGPARRLRFRCYPVDGDEVVAVDVLMSDEELRARHRSVIENQEGRFRTMAEMLPVAIWEASLEGDVTYVNPTFTALTGYTSADVPDLPMLEIVHPDDVLGVMEAAAAAPEAGEYVAQYRVRHLDGTTRWARSRLAVLVDEDGSITGFVGSLEDVDDLHKAERYANRLADIVERASEAVAVFERGRLVYLNAAATELLEGTDPAFTSDPRSHVFSAQPFAAKSAAVKVALQSEGQWSGEIRQRDAAGEVVDLSVTVTAELDADGEVGRMAIQARDIGEQKRREAALTHEARHDPLTGLANRHSLHDAVRASAQTDLVGALYVDIDHFKRINDDAGHSAGDAVLVEVARRLESATGPTDLVARMGGDEIVVWCAASDVDGVLALARQLLAAINATPIVVAETAMPVTVTIGVAAGPGSEGLTLIKRADAALYRAKQTGRNRWFVAPEPGR